MHQGQCHWPGASFTSIPCSCIQRMHQKNQPQHHKQPAAAPALLSGSLLLLLLLRGCKPASSPPACSPAAVEGRMWPGNSCTVQNSYLTPAAAAHSWTRPASRAASCCCCSGVEDRQELLLRGLIELSPILRVHESSLGASHQPLRQLAGTLTVSIQGHFKICYICYVC